VVPPAPVVVAVVAPPVLAVVVVAPAVTVLDAPLDVVAEAPPLPPVPAVVVGGDVAEHAAITVPVRLTASRRVPYFTVPPDNPRRRAGSSSSAVDRAARSQ
jgi:hypothetical protein